MNQLMDKIPYDQINGLPEWQRWAAVGGVLVLLFGLYFYFFYTDGEKKIAQLAEQLKTVEDKLQKTKQLSTKLPKLKEKIKLLEENLATVRQELPSEREIPYFLKTISEEGKKAGLEFLLFQPEPEQTSDFYARVPVKIEVISSFHQSMVFFDQVRRLPRIVDIENIAMTIAPGGKPESPILRTACYATTYKYIEGAEKKEAPPPPKKK